MNFLPTIPDLKSFRMFLVKILTQRKAPELALLQDSNAVCKVVSPHYIVFV